MKISFANPLSLQPLTFKKQEKNKHTFFLSFSDAFRRLAEHAPEMRKEIILIPNFYCPATINLMKGMMAKTVFYKINDDLSVNKESYFKQISKHKPGVIINYSFLGFTLTKNEQKRLKTICPKKTFVIEDCAHRILREKDIAYVCKNHIYIDSIRKHCSLLGANMYAKNLPTLNRRAQKINAYKFKNQYFQTIKNFFDLLTHISGSEKFHSASQRWFLKGDELIGTHAKPTLGGAISRMMYERLDKNKIKQHLYSLTAYYTDQFKKLNSPHISIIPEEKIKSAELCYYPLLISQKIQKNVLEYLKKHGIVAEKLWDMDTADKEVQDMLNKNLFDSLVILPLTWMIREKHIQFIAKKLHEYTISGSTAE